MLKGREYPLLILPLIEMLEGIGKPYVLENVMGARHGSKNLEKRGLETHGLKAGFLCGGMFGRPFYRHRLFAANWLWLALEHPKHQGRVTVGASNQQKGRGVSEQIVANPVNTEWRRYHDGALNIRPGYEKNSFNYPTLRNTGGLSKWQIDNPGVGVGKARGWHLAAEAMGIDWMNRDELTQAIPPVFTEHIGKQLLELLERRGT